MKIKKTIIIALSLLTILFVFLVTPRVSNPNTDFQTKLTYGEPINSEIRGVLTPQKKPERTRAVVILQNEKIIYEYGPTDKIMNTASMRKSILGLLYGIAVDKGLIDINKTLKELNVDESTDLTEQEKTATIKHLLMSKSGIYLPAQGEHDSQITDRPKRESHKPGEYFFSNNFDANALGTIFMQETGITIGKFMEEYLAEPIGLQDFSEKNVILGDPWFFPKKESKHKQYYIYLSARDLARIGSVVAHKGKWNGKQIISEKWISESTSSHSNLKENHIRYTLYDGFGYQWWISSINNHKNIWSDGYGERFLIINQNNKLVSAELNFTGNSFLTTGLWMMNRNMDSGIANLQKAHKMIIENTIQN